jgi:hypothetical protein
MQPNVFLAPKPRHPGTPPTLGQVKDAFPLPGQYHFRFKAPLTPGSDREKSAMAVWMDMVDERQPVPTWKNGIIVKVTRVSMEDDDDDDDDDDDNLHRHHHPTSAPPQQRHATSSSIPQPSRAPLSHNSSMASAGSSMDDLLASPPPVSAPAPANGGSLLDFNDHVTTAPASSAAVHHDFFGITTAPPASRSMATISTPTGVPTPPPSSGGYLGNPNLYASSQSLPQQPPPFNTGYTQQQQQGDAFGGLGTPWK